MEGRERHTQRETKEERRTERDNVRSFCIGKRHKQISQGARGPVGYSESMRHRVEHHNICVIQSIFLFMNICTHTRTHAQAHAYAHAHIHTHTHTHAHTRTHTHTHTHTYTCTQINRYLHMSKVHAMQRMSKLHVKLSTSTHSNALQHTATHCNTLQRTAAYYNPLHCNTLQLTATHCNAQSEAICDVTGKDVREFEHCNALHQKATHCNALPHTATYCNTLQHTATHYNTL